MKINVELSHESETVERVHLKSISSKSMEPKGTQGRLEINKIKVQMSDRLKDRSFIAVVFVVTVVFLN